MSEDSYNLENGHYVFKPRDQINSRVAAYTFMGNDYRFDHLQVIAGKKVIALAENILNNPSRNPRNISLILGVIDKHLEMSNDTAMPKKQMLLKPTEMEAFQAGALEEKGQVLRQLQLLRKRLETLVD